jgi:hypothetical protein
MNNNEAYLIIPQAIYNSDLSKSNFSDQDIAKAAMKAYKGLGIKMPSRPYASEMVKVRFTTKNGAGRALFLIKRIKNIIIPVLISLKKDKHGLNIAKKIKT